MKGKKNKLEKTALNIQNWVDITTNNTVQSDFESISMNGSILPIAMKVSAQTIGMDLVSVQPLSAPIGNMYYYDFKYDWNDINYIYIQITILGIEYTISVKDSESIYVQSKLNQLSIDLNYSVLENDTIFNESIKSGYDQIVRDIKIHEFLS